MCCLKLSKNIIPFAVTFTVGVMLVGLVSGIFASYDSPIRVERQEVEVELYSSKHKKKTMCNVKMNDLRTDDATADGEVYIYPSDITKKEPRIVEPTFEETIIINE